LKRTRITYNWARDTIYTLTWTLIVTTLFVIVLQTIIHPGESMIKPWLAINGLFVPIITFFIGLRPVLSLFTLPDTLFLNEGGQLTIRNGDIIKTDNIKSLEINQVGFGQGHLVYYELTFFEKPISWNNRKRSSLILTERYNIKYIFQTRTDFIDKLIDLGLSEKAIQWKQGKTKHLFGIRDRFQK